MCEVLPSGTAERLAERAVCAHVCMCTFSEHSSRLLLRKGDLSWGGWAFYLGTSPDILRSTDMFPFLLPHRTVGSLGETGGLNHPPLALPGAQHRPAAKQVLSEYLFNLTTFHQRWPFPDKEEFRKQTRYAQSRVGL